MVKKVSKKKTSSSSHKAKKHITHTKPAAEQLNVEPVVQQINKPIQNVTLNVEQPIHIEPASIFKDDTPEISVKSERHEDGSNIIKIFAIILCCIVVLFWIGLSILSIEINPGPRVITKNVSVTTYGYAPISLAKYMNINDVKYSEEIREIGYLRQERTDKDLIKKYVVDDNGNKIELMLRGISQGEKYDNLFHTGLTSKEIYNISGTFRFEVNRYVIEVDNITVEYRALKEFNKWSMENITTDDVKGVTFDIARGVNKIVSFGYRK
jgi:hypothetical protein